ncbi:glycerophosphodiester phosphodiesterase family protein [Geofilum rhodophaeum]|uniref:glycerophosphodiester phosphodiesterase family protein n=1 Tax=Geofilum rhodophaeum TaxID=1965019 RepID=UPI000B520276|nr:glycerophosphodiester phosphodiesterase family protein [Geofilum rhodophaeum]
MTKATSAILSLCLLSVFGHFIQAQKPDLQGHRGARGLLPENTIPSMLKALDMGASTLELDVVISADHQVVVSHEPWMNHEIATPPSGDDLTQEDKEDTNLYRMTYSEIKKWDVGQKGHPGFPL